MEEELRWAQSVVSEEQKDFEPVEKSATVESLTDSEQTQEDRPIGCAEFVRDKTYYFDLVTFEVENCLFRVSRQNFLKQFHVFRDMFALPPGDQSDSLEGSSDNKPIRLEGVDKASFNLLLMTQTC
ncbi:hypothetical protein M0805_007992 [Coniferiporia weirii]|nr:hypothetical protein M0805_007992 [Coniferiporia weirii]